MWCSFSGPWYSRPCAPTSGGYTWATGSYRILLGRLGAGGFGRTGRVASALARTYGWTGFPGSWKSDIGLPATFSTIDFRLQLARRRGGLSAVAPVSTR